jgi:hypothetical protein
MRESLWNAPHLGVSSVVLSCVYGRHAFKGTAVGRNTFNTWMCATVKRRMYKRRKLVVKNRSMLQQMWFRLLIISQTQLTIKRDATKLHIFKLRYCYYFSIFYTKCPFLITLYRGRCLATSMTCQLLTEC